MRIKESEKCPICGHRGGWCCLSKKGDAVLCARVMSEKKVGNRGAGWLHILSARPEYVQEIGRRERPETNRPIPNWLELHSRCLAALPDSDALADELGVSPESLGRMEYGFAHDLGCYTFPMKDSDGRIIGLRTRYRTGAKMAVRGSRNGIFIPKGRPGKELWICEGPTDCAALLTLGKFAIGRPSNVGGMDLIVEYVNKQKQVREVIIMADRDLKPDVEKLTMYAANELGATLQTIGKRVMIVRPQLGFKDIRAWLIGGLTANVLNCICADGIWKDRH